uniref:Uncharacterized protein n=1 Tax=Arundo donax TaxID=35708 RepID=A0A0A8Y0X7_ARUDO
MHDIFLFCLKLPIIAIS